jgi:hypothetical protein
MVNAQQVKQRAKSKLFASFVKQKQQAWWISTL